MKLFRRKEPKTTHPHRGAMQHLQNAHQALMNDNATEGMQHIGRAFKAVQLSMPKPPATPMAAAKAPPVTAPRAKEPDADDSSAAGVASLNLGLKGLRGLKGKV